MTVSKEGSPAPVKVPHVIVVGGGLAALSSAIEAAKAGAKVTLLEKEPRIGGNSAKATSGINAAGSRAQKAQNITDSNELFAKDTLKSGGGYCNEPLVSALTQSSADAIAFLESFGITLDKISQCGGHSIARTHREKPLDGKPAPVGWDIIKALKTHIDSLPKLEQVPSGRGTVTIINRAKVHELLHTTEKGQSVVHGVKYQNLNETGGVVDEVSLEADSVILATGGYCAAPKYLPDHLKDMPTTNGNWASGDALEFTKPLNAYATQLDFVQLHPTGFVDPKNPSAKTKFLGPEALRGHGGILINPFTGKRFCDELGRRDEVTAAIQTNCVAAKGDTAVVEESFKKIPSTAYLVMPSESVKQFDPATIGFYTSKGFFFELKGIKAMAEWMGVKESVLRETLTAYTNASQGKQEDAFGKKVFPVAEFPEDDTYSVCIITPVLHYTMGGIAISPRCEVLTTPPEYCDFKHDDFLCESKPIKNLFAAGEVSAGVHGKNRLAGNSLLECVVFGRRAGWAAAKGDDVALSPHEFLTLKLKETEQMGKYCKLLRFALPRETSIMGTGIGGYIALRAKIDDEEIVRYYSPSNRPDQPGVLDILIKVDDKGKMSHFLSTLPIGGTVDVKGPMGGLDLQLSDPDGKIKKIGMIAGGTGISPMVQVIRSTFVRERRDIEMKLIYGALEPTELVWLDVLQKKEKETDGWLKVMATVDKPTEDWTGESGFIDEAKVKKFMFPPSDDLKIIICGPWKMCQVMKSLLESLGYSKNMVFSYM